jgi:uncharacterized protein (UPF0332 family)
MAMARRAVAAATRNLDAGDAATAANRAYYAMLYAALAALLTDDVEVRRHSAVHAAFGARFAKTARLDPRLHRWLLDAFDLRLLADYDPLWTLEAEAVRETVEQATRMIDTIEAWLAGQGGA